MPATKSSSATTRSGRSTASPAPISARSARSTGRRSGASGAPATPRPPGRPGTLLSAWSPGGAALAPLWLGVTGPSRRLTAILAPEPGRSPHYWFGPALEAGAPFDLQLALHGAMGPGGVLWRAGDEAPWSSLDAASPWGAERLVWPERWSVGHGPGGPSDRPFAGADLAVSVHCQGD